MGSAHALRTDSVIGRPCPSRQDQRGAEERSPVFSPLFHSPLFHSFAADSFLRRLMG